MLDHARPCSIMLDHVGFVVPDLARSSAFYDSALAPPS